MILKEDYTKKEIMDKAEAVRVAFTDLMTAISVYSDAVAPVDSLLSDAEQAHEKTRSLWSDVLHNLFTNAVDYCDDDNMSTVSEDFEDDYYEKEWDDDDLKSDTEQEFDAAVDEFLQSCVSEDEDIEKIVFDYASRMGLLDDIRSSVGDATGLSDKEIIEVAVAGPDDYVSEIIDDALKDFVDANYNALCSAHYLELADLENSFFGRTERFSPKRIREARGRKSLGDTRDLWEKIYDELISDTRTKYRYLPVKLADRYSQEDLVIDNNTIRVVMPSEEDLDFAYDVANFYEVRTKNGKNEKGFYVDLIIPEDKIKDM